MTRSSSELDELLHVLAALYLGTGAIAWLAGCGLKPLAVAGASVVVLSRVYKNLASHGSVWPA